MVQVGSQVVCLNLTDQGKHITEPPKIQIRGQMWSFLVWSCFCKVSQFSKLNRWQDYLNVFASQISMVWLPSPVALECHANLWKQNYSNNGEKLLFYWLFKEILQKQTPIDGCSFSQMSSRLEKKLVKT